MENKSKFTKIFFQILAALGMAAFFVPWVSAHFATVDVGGGPVQINIATVQSIRDAGLGDYVTIAGQNVAITSGIAESLEIEITRHSPFNLALGVDFPYYGQYPALFLLLLLPAMLNALAFTKVFASKLMLVPAAASLFALTIFNMYFAFGLNYRGFVESTIFFWLAIILHVLMLAAVFFNAREAKEAKVVENISPPYNSLQRTVIVAMMLALAVVIGLYAITINIGGVNALRISFSGIFNNISAIFFGPFFGGIQRALQDIINHFMNPGGAFLWPVTVVAFLRGAATGWMWLKVRNVRPKIYSRAYTVIFSAIFVFGLFNLFMQLVFPEAAYVTAIAPREGQGLFFSTAFYLASWGLIAAGLIGLIPQFVVYKLTRKKADNAFYNRFIKLLVAILAPGLLFNSINSLIIFFTAVSAAAIDRGFVYWWAPRFFEELLTSTIIVYVMVILINVYEKAMRRKLETRE